MSEPRPSAKTLKISDVTEQMSVQIVFSISLEDMQKFAELSGDFNPLHIDDAFAQLKGYKGRVVYGALLIAKISQLIGMELPGRDSIWSSLSLTFHRPLLIGETAQAEATVTAISPATGMITLKLTLQAGGALLAKGSAEVLLRSPT